MIYRGMIDLSIQPNRLTGHDRLEGLSADIVPEYAFSTERVLIADQEALEVGLVELCRTLLAARWRLFAYPRARIAHVSQPLTPVERAALRAGLLNAGFSQALFPEPSAPPARLAR